MSRRIERFIETDYNGLVRPHTVMNPFATVKSPTPFEEIEQILIKERATTLLYDEAWKVAEKEFKRKKQANPHIFRWPMPDEYFIAIICYTQDKPPFYKIFNQAFRNLTNETSWRSFPFKSFYYILQMTSKFRNSWHGIIEDEPKKNRTLYRGIQGHFTSKIEIGDRFYFDYVASCSADYLTAADFSGEKGTIIELENGALEATGIRKYSMIPMENEVIVFPTNRFKVIKFDKSGPRHKLVLKCNAFEYGDVEYSISVSAW